MGTGYYSDTMPGNDNIYTNYESLPPSMITLNSLAGISAGARDVVRAIWQFMNIEALLMMMIVWKILSGSSGEDYYEQVALPDNLHITLNVLHTLDRR